MALASTLNDDNDYGILCELIVQKPKLELPQCTLHCRPKNPHPQLTGTDFFAVIDGYYSALVLSKGGNNYFLGFRPSDWDAVQQNFQPGKVLRADMYPMDAEINVYQDKENLSCRKSLKSTPGKPLNLLPSRPYPQLSSLREKLESLDVDGNGKIDLCLFRTALKTTPGFYLTEEEVFNVFAAIDSHDLGCIFFEDIINLMDTLRLPSILNKFLRSLGIEPKQDWRSQGSTPRSAKSVVLEDAGDVVEVEVEDLQKFITDCVASSTEKLQKQLFDNQKHLEQVTKEHQNQQEEIRKIIQREAQKRDSRTGGEESCNCSIM